MLQPNMFGSSFGASPVSGFTRLMRPQMCSLNSARVEGSR
jgi:hypothetical protein